MKDCTTLSTIISESVAYVYPSGRHDGGEWRCRGNHQLPPVMRSPSRMEAIAPLFTGEFPPSTSTAKEVLAQTNGHKSLRRDCDSTPSLLAFTHPVFFFSLLHSFTMARDSTMRRAAQCFLWTALASTAVAQAGDSVKNTSVIYLDNIHWLADYNNLVKMSWPAIEAAFAQPNFTDSASFSGRDWTKPYPGTPINGFGSHLSIAFDVPMPDQDEFGNETTTVSAITYNIPPSLMNANGLPKPMDPSWFICQHYWISAVPDPLEPVDHACGFLSEECRADIAKGLTQDWALDDAWACSAYAFDAIPESCEGSLGLIRQDVLGWDGSYFEDAETARTLTTNTSVHRQSWMVGTGRSYKDHNQTAHYTAMNRTYVLATVFGYSDLVDKSKAEAPFAQLSCLRPQWEELPAPPEEEEPTFTFTFSSATETETETATRTASSVTTSTVTTSGTTTKASSTSTTKVSSTSTSASTGKATSSTPTATTKTTTTSTKTSSAPTSFCTEGAIRSGISGNFIGLCSYNCEFNNCVSDACQCVAYGPAPRTAPATIAGKRGCPADGVPAADRSMYVPLCDFVCSRGYCPDAACKYC
ncbi:hypothetical protein QBC35DRAFT_506676 [Podospora australis]|uniref:Uncharacterized protein n=1 Tax=Podospora australis TaxID=1536484 RepID=A0AAN6WML0_9PEZI|nr:hypothetical protein QBC35DRAFT_506676 [Podospora australis]